jgi:RNase adaptor protein for sRNA GlmZ degradation
VKYFNDNVFGIISRTVDNYLERNFDHLSVSFGCTGGQHRSVYCAEQLFERMKANYNIRLKLNHTMMESW